MNLATTFAILASAMACASSSADRDLQDATTTDSTTTTTAPIDLADYSSCEFNCCQNADCKKGCCIKGICVAKANTFDLCPHPIIRPAEGEECGLEAFRAFKGEGMCPDEAIEVDTIAAAATATEPQSTTVASEVVWESLGGTSTDSTTKPVTTVAPVQTTSSPKITAAASETTAIADSVETTSAAPVEITGSTPCEERQWYVLINGDKLLCSNSHEIPSGWIGSTYHYESVTDCCTSELGASDCQFEDVCVSPEPVDLSMSMSILSTTSPTELGAITIASSEGIQYTESGASDLDMSLSMDMMPANSPTYMPTIASAEGIQYTEWGASDLDMSLSMDVMSTYFPTYMPTEYVPNIGVMLGALGQGAPASAVTSGAELFGTTFAVAATVGAMILL